MNDVTNPSDDLLPQCSNAIDRLDDLLSMIEPLTPDEVRHLSRLARRREVAVRQLATLCRAFGLDGIGAISVNEMLRAHDEVIATRRVLEKLDLVRARLDAKRMAAETTVADHVHFFYDLARRLARGNDAVRAQVAPVVALFQTQRTLGTKRRGEERAQFVGGASQ